MGISGEEGDPQLELAYALSVHQTQGSQFRRTFVVIPNPCRMLSREMLYTALTRHQDELVVLHQGPLPDLWRYTDGYYSDVAARMTNLVAPASPRTVRPRHETGTRYLEAGLVHRTERGELVRSKSELLITSMLHARRVPYVYEEPLSLAGWRCLPDFTLQLDDRGLTFYWEHLGLLDDPAYALHWEAKLARYRAVGIRPHTEGGSAGGTLLVTRDQPGGTLDASEAARLIEEVILGVCSSTRRDSRIPKLTEARSFLQLSMPGRGAWNGRADGGGRAPSGGSIATTRHGPDVRRSPSRWTMAGPHQSRHASSRWTTPGKAGAPLAGRSARCATHRRRAQDGSSMRRLRPPSRRSVSRTSTRIDQGGGGQMRPPRHGFR